MSRTTLTRIVLLLAVTANLAPLAYTGLLLTPGTVAGGGADARLRFIAGHQAVWSVGWIAWMTGSLGLVLSVWTLARVFQPRLPPSEILRFAPVIATIGATIDITGDALQATALPTIAGNYVALAAADPRRANLLTLFTLADQLATALSGIIANTLYCLAGALVVMALARAPGMPRWITALGAVTWVVTLAATPTAMIPTLAPVTVAAALFLYAGWLLAIAIWGLNASAVQAPIPRYHRV
jgi:hypothetical protein